MKVTISRDPNGAYRAYIPKKDLETSVIELRPQGTWGGVFVLENGWEIEIPAQDEHPNLPRTFNARRVV